MSNNIRDHLVGRLTSPPQAKIAVEVLFLIHLITAFPILMNPPSQLFESILNIPLSESIYH